MIPLSILKSSSPWYLLPEGVPYVMNSLILGSVLAWILSSVLSSVFVGSSILCSPISQLMGFGKSTDNVGAFLFSVIYNSSFKTGHWVYKFSYFVIILYTGSIKCCGLVSLGLSGPIVPIFVEMLDCVLIALMIISFSAT